MASALARLAEVSAGRVVGDATVSRRKTNREEQRFAGLYLAGLATSPMKTLVIPVCGLSAGARLEIRARTSVHTVRLKEPLEEQADFIWTPFEILERQIKNEGASDDEASNEGASQVA